MVEAVLSLQDTVGRKCYIITGACSLGLGIDLEFHSVLRITSPPHYFAPSLPTLPSLTDASSDRKYIQYRKNTAIMRLTTDLINNSLSFINCLTERELDLRGALKRTDTTLV
jgi:hypothetical protein